MKLTSVKVSFVKGKADEAWSWPV